MICRGKHGCRRNLDKSRFNRGKSICKDCQAKLFKEWASRPGVLYHRMERQRLRRAEEKKAAPT